MEKNTSTSYYTREFSEFYQAYWKVVCNYISYRIPNKYEAEDLTQDVFIRLWECWNFVNKDTVWSLVYTIARHITIDKLRRYYRQEDFITYIYNNAEETKSRNSVEDDIYYHDLEQMHTKTISLLPGKRRRIYELTFNDMLSCSTIADRMCLSRRTVEGHLLAARKTVRVYLQNVLLEVG